MTSRDKWKIKNLGIMGYIKSKFRKKVMVKYDGRVIEPKNLSEVKMLKDWTPFMLVKPAGAAKLHMILEYLKRKELKIERVILLNDYNEAMKCVFGKVNPLELAVWTQINQQFYADSDGMVKAYMILFSKDTSVDILTREKIQIRRICGIDFYTILIEDQNSYETSVTPVHVPDEDEMQKEYSILREFT